MSHQMRRALLQEATGPDEDEFASEGVTFLVGIITPYGPDRLFQSRHLTPVDKDYTRYEYLDAMPDLIGTGMVGALFASGKKTMTPAQQKEQMRKAQARSAAKRQHRGTRMVNRTGAAARALLAWFEGQGGEVQALWSAPGRGNGFTFEAEDEFTVLAIQDKARNVAKDPRYHSYVSVIPSATEGQYLVSFVIEPTYLPFDWNSALDLADASTDPETADAAQVSWNDDEIIVTPTAQGIRSGAIGDFFKKTFGPKKAENIEKKIAKIKEQLAYWEGKLQEAKDAPPAAGLRIGNVYGARASKMMNRFDGQEVQRMPIGSRRRFTEAEDVSYDAHDPDMFVNAEDVDYDIDDPDMFEDAEDQHYGDIDDPAMFANADDVHYIGDVGDLVGRGGGGGGRAKRRHKRHRQKRQEKRQDKRQDRQQKRKKQKKQQQQQQQQPQIIILRQGSGNEDDGGYDDEDDDYDDEDGSDGLPGRVYDAPRSPNGFVITYPAGG